MPCREVCHEKNVLELTSILAIFNRFPLNCYLRLSLTIGSLLHPTFSPSALWGYFLFCFVLFSVDDSKRFFSNFASNSFQPLDQTLCFDAAKWWKLIRPAHCFPSMMATEALPLGFSPSPDVGCFLLIKRLSKSSVIRQKSQVTRFWIKQVNCFSSIYFASHFEWNSINGKW